MYVNLLAVSASVRGKGIGSEMMNALIKKSEEDQAVITLVNYEEHNVGISLDFDVHHECHYNHRAEVSSC